ncbi:MAG TPA: MarR family transcriptional regulator [Diaminobutyricibacter sp.]
MTDGRNVQHADAAAPSVARPLANLAAEGDDDFAGRLALAIGRLNRRMRSSAGGLSHGQLSALSSIVRKGPLRPSELAAIEVVAAPTITRVVADLEARGLVERQPDTDDRRSVFVAATDEGVELLLRARSDRARTVVALLAERTPAEQESIRAALEALEAAAAIDPTDR